MAARSVNVPRSVVRRAEVQREFAEAQATDDWLWPTRYQPPWRLRYPDGEYSAWFGPSGQEGLDRQLADWRETYAAGGLWDPEEDSRTRTRARRDAPEMHALADRHLDELGARERDVYTLTYRQGMKPRAIAASMGIAIGTVRGILKGLRARRARWEQTRQP